MKKNLFMILGSLFCVSLIVSNIIAGKLYQTPFGFVLPAAVWLFPIVYILGDVIPEVYGLSKARQIILMGFLLNLFSVGIFLLTLKLPYPSFWSNQSSFQVVLGITPRLLLASFCAYLVGTNVNAWSFIQIKFFTKGKFLWMRSIGSTLLGESLDSLIFISIAFFGLVPLSVLGQMILAQAGFKIIYEILATPLTYLVVNYVRKTEMDNLGDLY